jgi:ectoine hydroxylase-related dioxygenase (phytanoyl-CoA dioxygenase family)
MALTGQGWLNVPSNLGQEALDSLRGEIFLQGRAGSRCLLDHPLVHETAVLVREQLVASELLDERSVAIQAIAFDKTPQTNWKVLWHQDVMFPFARTVSSPGYTLACEKDGIPYARPPVAVLEELTAVRLSLDPCDSENGPLRVSPGTHIEGIIPTDQITDRVSRAGEITCTNDAGDLLLMKPLLLHASSQATSPRHRRILHLVYHNGEPVAEPWHRAV